MRRYSRRPQRVLTTTTATATRAPTRLVIAGGVPHVHFRDSLDAAGMRLFPCIGDGNCLFRSVAHQLYGDQVSE